MRLRLALKLKRNAAAALELMGLALIITACALVWLPLGLLVAGALMVLLAQGVVHDVAD